MTDAPEIWKPIPGFEGIYEVSNYGLIRSLGREVPAVWKHKVGVIKTRTKIMKVRVHKKYLSLGLTDANGRHYHTTVHQCVARAFHPNPLNLPEVDHLDTNKLNNRADNLEWVTTEENRRRAVAAGLMEAKKIRVPKERPRGELNRSSKLREFQVREILMATGLIREIAVQYGVTNSVIQRIRAGKAWTHVRVEMTPTQPDLFLERAA